MANISPIATQAPVVSSPMVSAGSSVSAAPVQQRVVVPSVQQAGISQDAKPTQKAVEQVVNQANQRLAATGSNESIRFTYVEKLDQFYISIVDQNTGKVVREFPSKDIIRSRIAMREMIGLILDKKA